MFDTVVDEEEENLDEEEERPELRDAVEIFRSPCTGQPSPGLVFVIFVLVRYRYYQEKWKTKDKTQGLHRPALCWDFSYYWGLGVGWGSICTQNPGIAKIGLTPPPNPGTLANLANKSG